MDLHPSIRASKPPSLSMLVRELRTSVSVPRYRFCFEPTHLWTSLFRSPKPMERLPLRGSYFGILQGMYFHLKPSDWHRIFIFRSRFIATMGRHLNLPAGDYLESSRSPEYLVTSQNMTLPKSEFTHLDITLHRWIQPSGLRFYSGSHHIHGAGCAHYTSPTQGVQPSDMYLQVRGERAQRGLCAYLGTLL